jgi:hypothetical protein
MDGLLWILWTASVGTGGRFGLESATSTTGGLDYLDYRPTSGWNSTVSTAPVGDGLDGGGGKWLVILQSVTT